MTPATIRKEIQIAASIAHVWQFIGSEEGLRQWWGVEVAMEAKQDGRCMERGVYDGAPYQLSGVVSVYDPPRQLTLIMHDGQGLAASPTFMRIAITLTEAGEQTLVQIVHEFHKAHQAGESVRQLQIPAPPPGPKGAPAAPAILNQLSGRQQSAAGSSVGPYSTATTRPFAGDSGHAWISQQEARWSAGLTALMQAVQQRKESKS
jgi:uncharacterized protein YndB with AHSA1/START domain